jgi:chorismate synthase
VQFRALGRDSPWAWDEEGVAGAAHLPGRQSARLEAASPVAADAIAKAVLRRDVSQAAGPERDPLGAKDAKVAVARVVAHRKSQEMPVARLQVPLE